MAILAFLRRLVVVGRGRQDGVHTGARGEFPRFFYCFVCGIGRCAGYDGDAPGGDFDRRIDDMQPLVAGESRCLASGAARNKEIDAGFNLPRDQIAQGSVVESAILTEWSDQSRAASTKLHRDKIARMRTEGKSCE